MGPGLYLDRISAFVLDSSPSLKLTEIFGVLKNSVGNYSLARGGLSEATIKGIERKKIGLASDFNDFYMSNGFITKGFVEGKMKENGVGMSKGEVEEFMVRFVEFKKEKDDIDFGEFFDSITQKKDGGRNLENHSVVEETPGLEVILYKLCNSLNFFFNLAQKISFADRKP